VEPSLLKESLTLFKAALAWAGERSDPTPAAQALYLLQTAKAHDAVRPEVYLQLMKQLTVNAGGTTAKYWDLLAMMLLIAPPGAGCEDFVLAFCLRHPSEDTSRRLIAQLHAGRYGERLLTSLPPAERLHDILRDFHGAPDPSESRRRFSMTDVIGPGPQAAARRSSARSRVDSTLALPIPDEAVDLV